MLPDAVDGNVIFDNSVEEDAKAGARTQRKRRLSAVDPIVWTAIRDESRISSANPSIVAVWRAIRVKEPLACRGIPLPLFPCHSLIDKGMGARE